MVCVVLDIEGTVCPIAFVQEILFPYFLDKYESYLKNLLYPLGNDDKISQILNQFPPEVTKSFDSLKSHIKDLVDNDKKVAPLKSFQGLVWKIGYEKGEIKAPLYDDAFKFITKPPSWVENIYIYSSGSVKAQKLLFGYVETNGESADLNPYLRGYFDITTSGMKQKVESYQNILKDIGSESPENVLFISDNVAEVKAALKAGMKSVVMVKPGNAPITDEDKEKLTLVKSFDEITSNFR